MYIEHQISILESFQRDYVTLKTGEMDAENKLHFQIHKKN